MRTQYKIFALPNCRPW